MYTPVYEQCGDVSSDTALVLIEEKDMDLSFNKLKSKMKEDRLNSNMWGQNMHQVV